MLIFSGGPQYSRSTKTNPVIEDNGYKFAIFGLKLGDLFIHQKLREFITTVAAEYTVSPPTESIFLLVRWSREGKLPSLRYIRDQYVGRATTGVSALTVDFESSPAHFDTEYKEYRK